MTAGIQRSTHDLFRQTTVKIYARKYADTDYVKGPGTTKIFTPRISDLYDHCSIKQVKLSESLYTVFYNKMAILSRTLLPIM